jgi:hypothetical protein
MRRSVIPVGPAAEKNVDPVLPSHGNVVRNPSGNSSTTASEPTQRVSTR